MSKLLSAVVSATVLSCVAARSALKSPLTRTSFFTGMFRPGLFLSTVPECSISGAMSAKVRPLLAPSGPLLLADRAFSNATRPSLNGSVDSSPVAEEIEEVKNQIKAVELDIKKVEREIDFTEAEIQKLRCDPTVDSKSDIELLRIKENKLWDEKSKLRDKESKLRDKENKLIDLRMNETSGKSI